MVNKWEYFCDESYYGLWCVREAGEKRWGHGFHVRSKDEAEGLAGLLNENASQIEQLKGELESERRGWPHEQPLTDEPMDRQIVLLNRQVAELSRQLEQLKK